MFLDIKAEVRFGCAVGLFFLVFVISSWTSGSHSIYPCLGMLCCIETTVFRFRAVSCSSYIVSVFQCPSSNDHELDYYLPANKSSRTSVCAPSKVSGSALVKINQMRLTMYLVTSRLHWLPRRNRRTVHNKFTIPHTHLWFMR